MCAFSSGGEHLVEVARVVWSGGRPRRPSLPPNSTMTISGAGAGWSGGSATASLVVAPLVPWLLTL
jgi:hypothetical protein